MAAKHDFEQLTRKIREVFGQNRLLLVLGWRDAEHTDETRAFNNRLVRFMGKLPARIPKGTSLVITTHDVDRSSKDRAKALLRRRGEVFWTPLAPDTIRELLSSFPQLQRRLSSAAQQSVQDPGGATTVPQSVERIDVEMMKFKPADLAFRGTAQTPEDRFASSFFELAGDLEGSLSKYEVSRLVSQHFGDTKTTQGLVKDGWLVPQVGAGRKKAGRYAAGTRLKDLRTQPPPSDPLEKARWLVSHESDFITQKAALEAKFKEIEAVFQESCAEIDRSLARIEEARKLIAALEKLVE